MRFGVVCCLRGPLGCMVRCALVGPSVLAPTDGRRPGPSLQIELQALAGRLAEALRVLGSDVVAGEAANEGGAKASAAANSGRG